MLCECVHVHVCIDTVEPQLIIQLYSRFSVGVCMCYCQTSTAVLGTKCVTTVELTLQLLQAAAMLLQHWTGFLHYHCRFG